MNARIASRRSSATGPAERSAAIRSGPAPSAVSRAVCMATQRWQPFLVAIVMTTTSRATGSSVQLSNSPLSLPKPSSSWGDAAHRAVAAGR